MKSVIKKILVPEMDYMAACAGSLAYAPAGSTDIANPADARVHFRDRDNVLLTPPPPPPPHHAKYLPSANASPPPPLSFQSGGQAPGYPQDWREAEAAKSALQRAY